MVLVNLKTEARTLQTKKLKDQRDARYQINNSVITSNTKYGVTSTISKSK